MKTFKVGDVIQFPEELEVYEKEDITPSLTLAEFNKIVEG